MTGKSLSAVVIGASLLLIGSVLTYRWLDAPVAKTPSTNEDRLSLPGGLSREAFDEARAAYLMRYGRAPSRLDALSFAAELAQGRQDYATAVACFQEIPSDHPRYGHLARYQQGFALLKLHRAPAAEKQLREFLALEDESPHATPRHHQDAMQRLRHILEVELRFRERHALLAEMHERNLVTLFDTMAYTFPQLLRWNGPQAIAWCEEFWKATPEDVLITTALARYRVGEGKIAEARQLLQGIPDEAALNPSTIAAWLYLHSQEGDWEAMDQMVSQLPPPKPGDHWLLLTMRGLIDQRKKRLDRAERCYQLLLADDPANAKACQGMVQILTGSDRVQEREQYVKKSEVLARIQNRLGWVENDDDARIPLQEIAGLCREIGLSEHAQRVDRAARKLQSPTPPTSNREVGRQ